MVRYYSLEELRPPKRKRSLVKIEDRPEKRQKSSSIPQNDESGDTELAFNPAAVKSATETEPSTVAPKSVTEQPARTLESTKIPPDVSSTPMFNAKAAKAESKHPSSAVEIATEANYATSTMPSITDTYKSLISRNSTKIPHGISPLTRPGAKPSRFWSLPGELRNRIYEEVLTSKRNLKAVWTGGKEPHLPNKITLHEVKNGGIVGTEFNEMKYVSRQFYAETAGLEAKFNRVEFDSTEYDHKLHPKRSTPSTIDPFLKFFAGSGPKKKSICSDRSSSTLYRRDLSARRNSGLMSIPKSIWSISWHFYASALRIL